MDEVHELKLFITPLRLRVHRRGHPVHHHPRAARRTACVQVSSSRPSRVNLSCRIRRTSRPACCWSGCGRAVWHSTQTATPHRLPKLVCAGDNRALRWICRKTPRCT